MWWVMLIDLWMLTLSCIPGIHPIWFGCILFSCTGCDLVIPLLRFLHLFSWKTLVSNSYHVFFLFLINLFFNWRIIALQNFVTFWQTSTWISHRYERLLLNHAKTPGFLALRGEEFNLGPVTRLDHSELLCNKVLLKYKRDRERFWHRHQKGAERVPPCSSLTGSSTSISRVLITERKTLKTQSGTRSLTHNMYFEITYSKVSYPRQ